MSDTIEQDTQTDKKDEQDPSQSDKDLKDPDGKKSQQLDTEIQHKESKLSNINKAIQEAEKQLEKIRKEKQGTQTEDNSAEEARIDFTDPGAQAWDKHITDKLSPLQLEEEKAKAEIRSFALKEFLADKPSLASSPDKLKELMDVYSRIKTATERNKEGVLIDLKRAFAAVYHDDLIDAARSAKFDKIREKQIFSEVGITEGATGYVNEREIMPQYSKEDREILAKWGITPEQHWEMQKEQKKKVQ